MHYPVSPRRDRRRAAFVVLAAALAASVPAEAPASAGAGHGQGAAASGRGAPLPAVVARAADRLPLRFERNEGHADPAVRYLARCRGFTLYLADDAAYFRLGGPDRLEPAESRVGNSPPRPVAGACGVLRLGFPGAAAEPRFEAGALLGSVSNYFLGSDPSRWRPGVRNHSGVSMRALWPGIDLEFRGDPSTLEYVLRGGAGADPRAARFSLRGQEACRVDGDGDLVLSFPKGEVRMSAPVAWQERPGGERLPLDAAFDLREDGTVGFALGRLDPALPFVVDPRVSFSTYLGGTTQELPTDIAVDPNGRVIVGGITNSSDFPVLNAFQSTYAGATTTIVNDAVVTVYNAALNAVAYSTYLGGNGYDDCYGVCSDPSGNVVAVGLTASTNFPTASALQSTNRLGAHDIYVTKFNSTGSSLVFSTYVGSGGADEGRDCAADSTGIYVAGATAGTDFPVANAVQSASGGGAFDAVFFKIALDGSALIWSTYYGGSLTDYCFGMALDPNGGMYGVGNTISTDFPVVSAFQPSFAGGTGNFPGDSFLVKIAASGTSASYATYLGGGGFDDCYQVAVNGNGEAYLTGFTSSTNFPTAFAYQPNSAGGSSDAYLSKFSVSGASLLFSTYFGGSMVEIPQGIGVDGSGNVAFCGVTNSTNLPIFNAFQSSYIGGTPTNNDGFVTRFNAQGSVLVYCSYIASDSFDDPQGLCVDSNGHVLITGITASTSFPTQGAIQSSNAGGPSDGYVMRIVLVLPDAPVNLTANAVGTSTVQLAWNDIATTETGYEVERRSFTGPLGKIATLGANSQAFTDNGVAPATTYTYRVRAFNLDGPSGWSNEAMATTAAVVPIPISPNALVATVIDADSIGLTWNDRSDNEVAFEVHRRGDTPGFSLAASLPPNTTSWTNDGLAPDTTYTYRVRAIGTSGVSNFSNDASGVTSATFTLTPVKGALTDSVKVGKDKVAVAGTFQFLPGSPDGQLNPPAEAITLLLVYDGAPVTIPIPAGDPGWKLKKTKHTWKSPKGSPTKVAVVLDTGKGTFKISVKNLQLATAPANPIRVSLRAGTDAGSSRENWTLKKPGKFKYP